MMTKEEKREYDKRWRKENAARMNELHKKWRRNNPEKVKASEKKWRQANTEGIQTRLKNNADKIRKSKAAYTRKKRHEDKSFKIKSYVSTQICVALQEQGCSKNGSCWSYLPYTMKQLKQHLESQFESWMTWDNYGKYNAKKWNDKDPATWTWQIDHIIPQSKLPYQTLEDEEFKKCWALDNLRPYSAKQNLLDGARKKV